jgi:hypothetical protein
MEPADEWIGPHALWHFQRVGAVRAGTSGRRRHLALHVIPQHQLLGVRVQIHLLVHPRCARHRHPVEQRMIGQSTPTAPRIPQIGTLSP